MSFGRDRRTGSASDVARATSAAGIGKRTLTEALPPVQCYSEVGAGPKRVTEMAKVEGMVRETALTPGGRAAHQLLVPGAQRETVSLDRRGIHCLGCRRHGTAL